MCGRIYAPQDIGHTPANLLLLEQCAIQACLRRNQYNESRCTEVIDALYDCCAAMYQRQGLAEKNVCCPKRPLLELKMKQRAQERGHGDAAIHGHKATM